MLNAKHTTLKHDIHTLNFEKTVQEFVAREQLLRADALYLVALSGGADSVALLRVMLRLGYRVEAAHCNFRLRGDESNRDETFVSDLCQKLGVKLHRIHFDTHSYADLHHVSIEMAARELRYGYFEQLCHDIGAEAVCVAHHRDDAVETLLLNLMRGAGIHGLTGIRPRNRLSAGRNFTAAPAANNSSSGTFSAPAYTAPWPQCSDTLVVRPLLCVSRNDILLFLDSIEQNYVTDSTNLVADVKRNKVRLNIIPLLEQISPMASAKIAEAAAHLADAERIYDVAMESARKRLWHEGSIEISTLLGEPSPRTTLFELLRPMGFSSVVAGQLFEALSAPPGRVFSSATHDAVTSGGRIYVSERRPLPQLVVMPEPGVYRITPYTKLKATLSDGPTVSRQNDRATLDADKLSFPLTVRPVATGDRFVPFGMKGSKLVSDYLTDLKMPLHEKKTQMVVVDANGRIIWLVNHRTTELCRVDSNTRRTLILMQINN